MRPLRDRGLVCVVTDRARLSPSAPLDRQLDALVEQACAAAAADADLFQIRERDLPDGVLLSLAGRIGGAVRGSDLRVLVNDRLDVALAADAHGVQLREDGLPVREVRRAAPAGFLIGRSVHDVNAAEEAARGGADFVLFGTMYPTESKAPGHRRATLEDLGAVARACKAPVLGIGGIGPANAAEVARIAAGVAAIGWFATTDAVRLSEAVRLARGV